MTLIRLGDVCVKIGSGATPRGGRDVYLDRGVPLIRSQNVHNDGFRPDGLAFIGPDHARELDGVTVQSGDVLLNITGDSVARSCEAPRDLLGARVNQHVSIIRPDASQLDPRFLRFVLVSPWMQTHLLALASAGATRNALTKGMIEDLRIDAPALVEQRAIASILGALDDKIELNRRMNETLEGLARALFKSWFVDFDPVRAKAAGRQPFGMDAETAKLFPDRFVVAGDGGVPVGWLSGALGDFLSIGIGGAWGTDAPTTEDAVRVHCLRGIDCHELAKRGDPAVPTRWLRSKQVKDRALSTGTVLIEGSGSFCGRSLSWHDAMTRLFDYPVCYSNFCKRLDPLCTPSQALVCWFKMREAFDAGELTGFRVGTAFPNFDVGGLLASFRVVVPPPSLADVFAEVVGQLRRVDLVAQTRTLATLRDVLLPKLLSGEVHVRDAERAVETAT